MGDDFGDGIRAALSELPIPEHCLPEKGVVAQQKDAERFEGVFQQKKFKQVPQGKRLVVIESPLRGDYNLNRAYAKACMRDSLRRGEAPYASHLLFDQPDLLDDTNPEERELGIQAGFAWGAVGALRAFYTDFGMSEGMLRGEIEANSARQATEMRRLKPQALWDALAPLTDMRIPPAEILRIQQILRGIKL